MSNTYDYESMRNRLAENDAINYAFAQEKGEQDLYKIIRKGIIGYDNMTNEELVSVHKDVFGYVDYKTNNTYEIEMSATTYRTFTVTANSVDEAEELAFHALDNDQEISGTWKDEARIVNRTLLSNDD